MFIPCEMPRDSEWGMEASLSVEGGNAFHKSTGVTMVTLQKGWAGAGRGGEHRLIVYLREVITKVFVFVTLQRAHCIPRQLPRVSTRSGVTRHWYLLMFHILPSGASTVVKKNNKTREAMRRHTQKKTTQNTSTGNTGQPSKWPGVQLAPGDCTKFCL